MKIETLKKLIEDEYHKTGDMEQFKEAVMEFIDLYASDNTSVQPFSFDDEFEEVYYHQICSCNPGNQKPTRHIYEENQPEGKVITHIPSLTASRYVIIETDADSTMPHRRSTTVTISGQFLSVARFVSHTSHR